MNTKSNGCTVVLFNYTIIAVIFPSIAMIFFAALFFDVPLDSNGDELIRLTKRSDFFNFFNVVNYILFHIIFFRYQK